MKFHWKFIIFLLCITFTLQSYSALAQAPNSIDGVEISTYPKIPSPGENVTVEVESYNTDLNSASIVWIINGKTHAQGIGRKAIDITAPAIGKNLVITVVIMTVEKREVRKVITIKSGGVDLIWESEGYVPPLYKGKSLFAYENPLKIIAIPHLAGPNGTELDPRTLTYKWKVNDKVILDQSGYGKQTLSIQESIPRSLEIRVEVGTPNGTQKAEDSVTLTPGDPSISFYEDDPLYGVLYNKNLGSKVTLTNQEITIRAVPYNFSSLGDSPLSFVWSINNFERKDLSTDQSITLRTKEGTEGSSNISLEIRNSENILQGARSAIGISFTKKSTQ